LTDEELKLIRSAVRAELDRVLEPLRALVVDVGAAVDRLEQKAVVLDRGLAMALEQTGACEEAAAECRRAATAAGNAALKVAAELESFRQSVLDQMSHDRQKRRDLDTPIATLERDDDPAFDEQRGERATRPGRG